MSIKIMPIKGRKLPMNQFITCLTILVFLTSSPLYAEEAGHQGHDDHGSHAEKAHAPHQEESHAGHDEHGHGGHEEEGAPIKLSPAQVKQAGIVTQILKPQAKQESAIVPGSIFFNAYRLADVTTLVDAVVYTRLVRLGDHVKKGQPLITLHSSVLARAEADYLRSDAEHRRSRLDLKRTQTLVKEKIASQARLQQANSTYQAAHANLAAARASLAAYGLSRERIDNLSRVTHYGELTLLASHEGTVIEDNFRIGQHINAGTRLLQIVDESSMWVEVKLSQSQIQGVHKGQLSTVTTQGSQQRYTAKVINIHHQLDQTTRTFGVRLEVNNQAESLHPGMFVQAEIQTGHGENALLLPAEAVQRQGGELIVFIEEEQGHFERREVRVAKAKMGMVHILEGIKVGEAVVIKGAFVLASELAKSGFAVHNH